MRGHVFEILRFAICFLRQDYDAEIDAVGLSSGKKRDEAPDLEDEPFVIIDIAEGKYEPIALEVIGISGDFPLEQNEAYCVETDTLTFGTMPEKADLVVENDDLVAYWRFDGPDSDDYTAVAVDLRNATRHLAPAIAAFKKRGARER